jgi:hypothetical protein
MAFFCVGDKRVTYKNNTTCEPKLSHPVNQQPKSVQASFACQMFSSMMLRRRTMSPKTRRSTTVVPSVARKAEPAVHCACATKAIQLKLPAPWGQNCGRASSRQTQGWGRDVVLAYWTDIDKCVRICRVILQYQPKKQGWWWRGCASYPCSAVGYTSLVR